MLRLSSLKLFCLNRLVRIFYIIILLFLGYEKVVESDAVRWKEVLTKHFPKFEIPQPDSSEYKNIRKDINFFLQQNCSVKELEFQKDSRKLKIPTRLIDEFLLWFMEAEKIDILDSFIKLPLLEIIRCYFPDIQLPSKESSDFNHMLKSTYLFLIKECSREEIQSIKSSGSLNVPLRLTAKFISWFLSERSNGSQHQLNSNNSYATISSKRSFDENLSPRKKIFSEINRF